MTILRDGLTRGRRGRAGRPVVGRRLTAAAAALLCGLFGLAAIAISGVPSGAATSATLYVDNVNGAATTGCTSSGAGACKTIQQGVTAAEALTGTAVTLDVAGSTTTYAERVTINLASAGGDSLDIEGTGATAPTLNSGGTGSNITIDTTSVGTVTDPQHDDQRRRCDIRHGVRRWDRGPRIRKGDAHGRHLLRQPRNRKWRSY